MRVQVVDPSAYTPPYDHALCAELARLGLDVELITSRFLHGEPLVPDGYRLRELFYRRAFGRPGSAIRTVSKLAAHPAGMVKLRRIAREADLVHFQWLPVQWLDARVLPRGPLVLTAHDLLPREARPGQARAQRRLYDAVDAVVVHSEYGHRTLTSLGVDPGRVHVIHHGAFEHLAAPAAGPGALPPELHDVEGPVVLFFGLLRPYKGIDVLLEAWRRIDHERLGREMGEGELWVVGRPRMSLAPLERMASATVRFVGRFVSAAELRAVFRRADVVVLPYSRTARFDTSGVLATALAFGKAIVLSEVGAFSELGAQRAAWMVPPDDPATLADALSALIADSSARAGLQAGARTAAERSYSWREAAAKTARLYGELTGISVDTCADPQQSRPP
jgi:glycosyltransferase involved in cell wall biosynthesis